MCWRWTGHAEVVGTPRWLGLLSHDDHGCRRRLWTCRRWLWMPRQLGGAKKGCHVGGDQPCWSPHSDRALVDDGNIRLYLRS